MLIKNAFVFGEDKTFTKRDIAFSNGLFADTDTDSCQEQKLDASGLYAIPGLVDIHFHGCMGHDFCDGTVDAIHQLARYEASAGVTSICPATMTISEKALMQVMQSAHSYAETAPASDEASFVGINMEGPFISESKKGAQASEHIRCCDSPFFEKLQNASGGLIKLVDIAPEENGALTFIDQQKEHVTISVAHSAANYNEADAAFRHGACHVTHLYNAMSPFSHRNPGIVGAAFDNKHVNVELICDGIHLHPSTVRATFQLFTDERIILISDSMRATGLKDGEYTLGGQDVTVHGKHATLTENGTLAGSVTNLMDCMITAVKEMGIPLESAIACATMNPAKAIGIYDHYGSISTGKSADLVLFDKDLNIKYIFLRGKQLVP